MQRLSFSIPIKSSIIGFYLFPAQEGRYCVLKCELFKKQKKLLHIENNQMRTNTLCTITKKLFINQALQWNPLSRLNNSNNLHNCVCKFSFIFRTRTSHCMSDFSYVTKRKFEKRLVLIDFVRIK